MSSGVTRLGHIALNVSDLQAMVQFYGDVLGFELVSRNDDAAFFRLGGDHHTLGLFREPRERIPNSLNHVAFQVADDRQLKDLYRRLKKGGIQVGAGIRRYPTDSFFICDPEGNDVELYADLHPDRDWTGVEYPGGRESVELDAG